jgi:hypothetical protein
VREKMENKDAYSPEEVAKIVADYATLVMYSERIGGGGQIAMPNLRQFGERVQEMARGIPENVVDNLRKKPSELEESIMATVKRSDK